MRGRFRSMPPTRVAPICEASGSWSRMPSGRKPTSTQSSMLVNRSTMPASRATIVGNFSRTRPVCSALVLCTIASKRSTCSPLVYPLSVNSPKWTLNKVRFHRGLSITTACRGDRSSPRQRGRCTDPEQRAQLRHVQPGPGPVHDGVEGPLHHRTGGEDQVAAVLELIDRVGVAEAAAALLVQVQTETQTGGVDPAVDDLAQAPYGPGLGQGVCDLSQAIGFIDAGEAVALLRKAYARRVCLAGDVLVAVEDHLRTKRRVPADLDRQVPKGRIHDVEGVVVDELPRLLQVADLPGAGAGHLPDRAPVPGPPGSGTRPPRQCARADSPRRCGACAGRPCSRSPALGSHRPRPGLAGQTGRPAASDARCPDLHHRPRASAATTSGTRPGCAPTDSRR